MARLLAEVHAFVAGAPQSDDITILAVHYNPEERMGSVSEEAR